MNTADIDHLLQDAARRWNAWQPTPPPLAEAVTRAQTSRRRSKSTWLAIAASVIVVIAIATIPVLRSLSTDRHSTHAAASRPSDSTIAKLSQIARTAAVANGDPHVTAEAVRTTYLLAEKAILGGDRSFLTPDNAPVWIIQIHGTFNCAGCSRPPGSHVVIKGTIITLIEDAAAFMPHDFTIGDQAHDLTALGTVVRLSP